MNSVLKSFSLLPRRPLLILRNLFLRSGKPGVREVSEGARVFGVCRGC